MRPSHDAREGKLNANLSRSMEAVLRTYRRSSFFLIFGFWITASSLILTPGNKIFCVNAIKFRSWDSLDPFGSFFQVVKAVKGHKVAGKEIIAKKKLRCEVLRYPGSFENVAHSALIKSRYIETRKVFMKSIEKSATFMRNCLAGKCNALCIFGLSV